MKVLIVVVSLALLVLVAAEPAPQRIAPVCPDYCTELYNPVCAMSQRCTALFGNPCKFDAWNCKTIGRDQFILVDKSYCRNLDGYNNIKCR